MFKFELRKPWELLFDNRGLVVQLVRTRCTVSSDRDPGLFTHIVTRVAYPCWRSCLILAFWGTALEHRIRPEYWIKLLYWFAYVISIQAYARCGSSKLYFKTQFTRRVELQSSLCDRKYKIVTFWNEIPKWAMGYDECLSPIPFRSVRNVAWFFCNQKPIPLPRPASHLLRQRRRDANRQAIPRPHQPICDWMQCQSWRWLCCTFSSNDWRHPIWENSFRVWLQRKWLKLIAHIASTLYFL